MLTKHIFEPLNLNAIPEKSNGAVLLLQVDDDWYGTAIWEHEVDDESIYIEQDGTGYDVLKMKIKCAYLIREK